MTFTIVLFFVGLVLLYYGADFLVDGSSRLALSFGVRPLIIGMTIVSFATSMPEMMVSLLAVGKGSSDIAVGNIVGSNIANIGLILGTSALLMPLKVPRGLLWRELPIMIVATSVLYGLCVDGGLNRADGVILLVLLALFIGYCLRFARQAGLNPEAPESLVKTEVSHRGRDVLYVVGGIVGLGVGANWMVSSAVIIARAIGLSELFIGMTIVALGTSLPELAASLMSAAKGEMDISIGNVIGSNIFNILFVLGVCPIFQPIAVEPSILRLELPVVMLFSVALVPLCWHRHVIGRWKGAVLVVSYVLFIVAMTLR
ncbi:calcium/sodium antiporter [Desulfuromonas acetoxidans]|uniref:calcium/sodium antiporter n=1 Tax=Desulfuromonas acetoxidans TaxID=891 RepID=UPI00292F4CC9|nr:calcium/sodium antiporter [Desulfuromonas acetoxidans]